MDTAQWQMLCMVELHGWQRAPRSWCGRLGVRAGWQVGTSDLKHFPAWLACTQHAGLALASGHVSACLLSAFMYIYMHCSIR